MTTISIRRFRQSLVHARRGLAEAFTLENNFRIHVTIAILVIVALIVFRVSRIDSALTILLISSVLTLELVNTVVERFVGLLEPRIHPYVRLIKDLMAAATLVVVMAAVVIGILLLWPYISHFFHLTN